MTREEYEKRRKADGNLKVTVALVNALKCPTKAQEKKRAAILAKLGDPVAVNLYRDLRDEIEGVLDERKSYENQDIIAGAFEDFKKSEAYEGFAKDCGLPVPKKRGFFSRLFGK